MKGYIVDGKAYIFPQTAAEIPEVEADVIYVQQEDYAAWLAANESLADKLVKYNYNVMTVKEKEWAEHTDDDLEPAQKEDPELAWSENGATVTIDADDNVYPVLSNPHNVSPLVFSSSDENAATINENGEITLVAAGESIISVSFAGDDTYESKSASYLLTVNAAQETTYTFEINEGGNLFTVGSYVEGDAVNYTFEHAFQQEEPGMWHYEYTISPVSLENNYTFDLGTQAYPDETDPENPVDVPEVPASISFTMPASDVTFTITTVQEEQTPQTSTITVLQQEIDPDNQPSGDPVQLSSDSYEFGTNQVIDLGIFMDPNEYTTPTCSDEAFTDWSFNHGSAAGDEYDYQVNATITINSVPNEDLTFTFEHRT